MSTTLDFDLDPVDVALKTLLDAITNLPVHYGSVGSGLSDSDNHVVAAPLPYLLYASGLGRSTSPRLGGALDRTVSFTLTFVHDSHEGAKAVGLAVRRYLNGRPVNVAGQVQHLRLSDPTDRDVAIDEDPTWTRPGGLPLFFGVDRFNVL